MSELQAHGCWPRYQPEQVEWVQDEGPTLSVHLKPISKVMHCGQCGSRCTQVHETTMRRVRDLPCNGYPVVLHVPRRRVWCERCGGPRLERLPWLGRYRRITERLAKACEKRLQTSSVNAVAAFYGLSCHTVNSIDQMRLRKRVAAPLSSRVQYLVIDEFPLHRCHRHATVLVDPLGRQLLWISAGRSRETARACSSSVPIASRRASKRSRSPSS